MMDKPTNWKYNPRKTATVEFECHAADGYFVRDLEDAPVEVREELAENGVIPCEGGGVVGYWCAECRFGKYYDD